MKNSPTLCQLFVGSALQPLRQKWHTTLIYHYMDDILLAQPNAFTTEQKKDLENTLRAQGLCIAPEKVQKTSPWKYLGWVITDAQIQPQKIQFNTSITTLKDAQQLLGDLQWLRPVIGFSADDLNMLRPLLASTNPAAPVKLTKVQ